MSEDAVTNADLDRVITSLDRSMDSLARLIEKNGETSLDLIERVTKVEVLIADVGSDVRALNNLVRGNGLPGLASRLSSVEQEIEYLKKKNQAKQDVVDTKTKGQQAKEVALITGAFGGLVALVRLILGLI